ncbi:hypothetical protein ABZ468_07655 [Streptomyces sp. NPDC005708]|uniref:hypothetical protein n=1 Tax=Streptomyces sp. NPDC005708 TaxID=3154564 RepID=UPI0033EC10BB
MSTATAPQGRNWATMRRADFDPAAPLDLVDARAVSRPVPAVVHSNGTDALFGDEPRPQRGTGRRKPAPGPVDDDTATLF